MTDKPNQTIEKPEAENVQTLSLHVEESELEHVQPAEIDQKTGQLILTPKHKELIAKQIAPTATKEELELFFMMAYRTRLDPLMKQLYFIKYGQGDRAKVSYVTSIDGYRIIAHRTGLFSGIDAPKYEKDAQGNVSHCTVSVYRVGSDRPFSATVKMSEYSTGQNLWKTMPETMIAKVAEAHALRKAFPQDLSGIYTTDEMDQMERANRISAPVMASKQQIALIMALTTAKGKTEADLKTYMKGKFGIDSRTQLTSQMAQITIKKLQSMPDPTPVEEPEDDGSVSDEAWVESVSGTLSNPLAAELDVDEIDKGIAQTQQPKYQESIQ
jgi:phage recombination protein Bet